MEERKYLTIWKKYLPIIRLHLKKSLAEEQQFKLNAIDFESSDRSKTGYTFSLNMDNGKVINNISGSAVARDLYEVLKTDESVKGLLANRNVKISVGKACILSIKNSHVSSFK